MKKSFIQKIEEDDFLSFWFGTLVGLGIIILMVLVFLVD